MSSSKVQMLSFCSVAGPQCSALVEVVDVSWGDSCHADTRCSPTPPGRPAGHQTATAGVTRSPPYGPALPWPHLSVRSVVTTWRRYRYTSVNHFPAQTGLRLLLDTRTISVVEYTEHFPLLMGLAWYFVSSWGGCHSKTGLLVTR